MKIASMTLALGVVAFGAVGAACDGDASLPLDPVADDGADGGSRPRPPSTRDPRPEDDDAGDGGKAERPVPGRKLVAGAVRLGGVTTDGLLPYLHEPAGAKPEDRSGWSAQVLDLRSGASTLLAPRQSVLDQVLARGSVVALWTRVKSPFGHGDLTLYSRASGVAKAPAGADSLRGIFLPNADGTRVALSYGAAAPDGVTNLAVASPSLATAPTIVVPNVGTCPVSWSFAGETLLVATCDGRATTHTVRAVSPTNAVTVLRGAAKPGASADATGSRALVLGTNGDATLFALQGGGSAPVASGVTSGVLALDGSAVVYTTTAGALLRASVAALGTPTTLAAGGVAELLLVSPDRTRALAAALPADTANQRVARRDLRLVSLTDAAPATVLVPAATAVPVGFARAGGHVLYHDAIPASGTAGRRLMAAPLAGGAPRELGVDVEGVLEVEGTTKAVLLVARADGRGSDARLVDLATPAAPVVVVEGVTDAVLHERSLYVTVGAQGLYAVDLP